MTRLRVFLARLAGLVRKGTLESDIDDELDFHLQMEIAENLRRGMPPAEARSRAQQRLGGVAQLKETYRETHALPIIEVLWQDIRFGLRMLRRSPGFSLLAILCLTLGIGATTAVFSWIEGILLRPFPLVAHQERMMAVTETDRATPGHDDVSFPDFLDFQKNCTLFDAFIVDRITGTTLAIGDRADRTTMSVVSANYFDALGVRPILGRGFEPAEDFGRNAHPVTVISYQMWQERFHGNPEIIGKAQMLNGMPHTIIGVAPRGFYGTFVGWAMQLWVPASMQETFDPGGYKLEDRGARWIEGFVRLKPGVTPDQAQAEISAVAKRLETAYPATNRGRGIKLYPLWQTPFNNAGTLASYAIHRAGSGGVCASHRVRERQQFAAGQSFRATSRDDGSSRRWRRARPAAETASHRRLYPRDACSGGRPSGGQLVPQPFGATTPRSRRSLHVPARRPRLASAGLERRRLFDLDAAVRARSRASNQQDRSRLRAQGGIGRRRRRETPGAGAIQSGRGASSA